MNKWIKNRAFVLLVALSPVLLVSCYNIDTSNEPIGNYSGTQTPSVVTQATPQSEHIYSGLYQNNHFGYSVEIPAGLKGKSSPPPSPENGFVVFLGTHDSATVSVFAELRPFDANQKAIAEEVQRNYLEIDEGFHEVEKRTFLLGHSPAVRFDFVSNTRSVTRIISLRRCPGLETEIMYSVEMTTNLNRGSESKRLFDSILASWQMTEDCDL